jgi:hypothetical protein
MELGRRSRRQSAGRRVRRRDAGATQAALSAAVPHAETPLQPLVCALCLGHCGLEAIGRRTLPHVVLPVAMS